MCAERQRAEPSVDRREGAAFRQHRQDAARADVREAGIGEQPAQPSGAQQHRILVDVAGFDDVLRRRIVGIVLEHKRQTAAPQYALRLRDEAGPLRGGT